MLPCLDAACCVKGSNPPHRPRSYLMMYLQDYFRDFARPPSDSLVPDREVVAKSHAFIRSLEWADYDPKITQEMLIHGATRRYLTPTCPTIYREGLCVGRCPFYDGKGANRLAALNSEDKEARKEALDAMPWSFAINIDTEDIEIRLNDDVIALTRDPNWAVMIVELLNRLLIAEEAGVGLS